MKTAADDQIQQSLIELRGMASDMAKLAEDAMGDSAAHRLWRVVDACDQIASEARSLHALIMIRNCIKGDK